jgi:hypothetical protein
MRAHEACFVRSHLSPANAAMAPPMGSGKPPRNGLETPETPGTNTLPPWKQGAMVLPGALIQCPGWRRSAAHPASPPEHPSRHLRGYPTAKDPKNPRRRSMRQRSEGQGSEGPGAEAQGSESQGSEGQGAEGQGSEGQRSEDQRRAWGSGSPPPGFDGPGPASRPTYPQSSPQDRFGPVAVLPLRFSIVGDQRKPTDDLRQLADGRRFSCRAAAWRSRRALPRAPSRSRSAGSTRPYRSRHRGSSFHAKGALVVLLGPVAFASDRNASATMLACMSRRHG